MKRSPIYLHVIALFIGFIPATVFAGTITFTEDSLVQIHGDSTMRKFSSVSTKLNMKGEAKASTDKKSELPWIPVSVEMNLNVNTLKSDSTTLDEHMYENLKAEKFPQILLKLTEFQIQKDEVTAKGTLTIAGAQKPVELKAELSREGDKLRIRGSQTLKMSDFGIEPPTLMLGAVRVQDKIEINFNVICLMTTKEEQK